MTTQNTANTIEEYVNWLVLYMESLSEPELELCEELARAGIADRDTIVKAVRCFRDMDLGESGESEE